MACGCPVVASSLTAIPEAVGDAGSLVDPGNKEEWVRAVTEALVGSKGQKLEAGRLWASGFSWDRTAEKLLEVVAAVAA